MFREILFAVVLITTFQGGKPVYNATGFFYLSESTSDIFLVTNRHVLINEAEKYFADSIQIKLHKTSSNLEVSESFGIPILGRQNQTWFQHPKYQSLLIDVAVIRLDSTFNESQYLLKAVSKDRVYDKRADVGPGDPVHVIGFPLGISDLKHNLPILKGATISSMYGFDFDGFPLFLIDANLYKGMSGSPVFTAGRLRVDREGTLPLESFRPRLIGVFSAQRQIPRPTNPIILEDVGAVWYTDNIIEIINTMK